LDIAKILWLRSSNCIEIVRSDGKKIRHSAKHLLELSGANEMQDAQIQQLKLEPPSIILRFENHEKAFSIPYTKLLEPSKK